MMHRGFIFVWSLIFAASPFWVPAEPIHRPMEEMRGGCSDYAMNLRAELDAIGGPPQQVVAVMEHGDAPLHSPSLQPILVRLHHARHVKLKTQPKTEGAYSGLLSFSVPQDGNYRLSMNASAWIEVSGKHDRMEAYQFEMQMGCSKLFKTISYRLQGDERYWLEISSNAREMTILVSVEGR